MKNFKFEWESKIKNHVDIEAETIEEAYHIWQHKKYSPPFITKEDILGDVVSIDGENFHNGILKKIDE